MMGLIEQAKTDIEQITGNLNDFGLVLIFESPTAQTVTINGLHTKHHLGIDTDGRPVNTKNAHISFSEKKLTDLSYNIRNNKGEVSLKNHKVSVKDSTGILKKYIIREWFPDETVGLITCILGDFE